MKKIFKNKKQRNFFLLKCEIARGKLVSLFTTTYNRCKNMTIKMIAKTMTNKMCLTKRDAMLFFPSSSTLNFLLV